MAIIVTVTDEVKKETLRVRTSETVKVETPSGTVFVNHDPNTGAMVLVRGEKATTTVKFNEKAVV